MHTQEDFPFGDIAERGPDPRVSPDREAKALALARQQYGSAVKIFFNDMVDEYCVEDHPWETLACGICGTVNPGDPCEGCGRVQPLSSTDYDRANCSILQVDELSPGFTEG